MTALETIHSRVTAPPVNPRPYGLFSVAPPIAPGDLRWTLGVTFDSVSCLDSNFWIDDCLTTGVQSPGKIVSRCSDVAFASFKPVVVYVALSRSGGGEFDVPNMARSALTQAEQFGAEAGLWSLMDAATTPVAGGAALVALAVVEQALADKYNGLGVIHMTATTATQLSGFLCQKGNLLTTSIGTPVVVGAGYATTPNQIIGTGALIVYRSTLEEYTGFDRAVNDEVTVAERTYLAAWDCFATAATVT